MRRTRDRAAIRVLFVANRGEIARRIARTAGRLGIAPVVPSTDGPGALDLLDGEAVVAAAGDAGADALHPGYGFLAERADFAEQVIAAGIRWVGPPPAAIRAVGDKAAARRLAAGLGVPVLPGWDEADRSDEALRAAATFIGLPLIVKPSGGGGGKGMHVVRDAAALDATLALARREALAAFGDDRLILERFLDGPRHVEIQVLFDAHGNGVHLGERDCSLQRRHQKVLEETPSPAVDPPIRDAMGATALRLAGAVGYESAGTVEFLLDDAGRYTFLEMNTRLQVEHPVTELVTGRDLVSDQLRIAAGEPLGFSQADVRFAGHAVEVRVYAEDAETGFLPATGTVVAATWPAGDGIRVDAGVDAGSVVDARFDPMLAKIAAWGEDRPAAFGRLAAALDRTIVLGVTTNLRFLRWLVRQPAILDGEARIDTLERTWPPAAWPALDDLPDAAWTAAANAVTADAPAWSGGWRLNARPAVRLSAEGIEKTVIAAGGRLAASARAGDVVHVDVDGRSVAFSLFMPPDVDRAARAAAHAGRDANVVAPMPGAVLAVHRRVGDVVEPGDPIVTLEAMKMEHVVTSPAAGTVRELSVAAGGQVTRGQVLATIDA